MLLGGFAVDELLCVELLAERVAPALAARGRFRSVTCGLAARFVPIPGELTRFLSVTCAAREVTAGDEVVAVAAAATRFLAGLFGLAIFVGLLVPGDGGSANSNVSRKVKALSASSSGLSKRMKYPLEKKSIIVMSPRNGLAAALFLRRRQRR